MKRVLIVEDNAGLAFGLRNNLELENYAVTVCATGPEGLAALRSDPPDLMILDWMLPEMEGIEVLRTLRGEKFTFPVLVLTARGEESDKVVALRMGADDYVTKPFGLMELIARCEVLLRRGEPAREGGPSSYAFGTIHVDLSTRTVLRDGERVELAPKEFDLLHALVRRQGAVASRQELLDEVWGYAHSVVSRTVDTHIGELRRKLEENPATPRFLLTIRKVGYRFGA